EIKQADFVIKNKKDTYLQVKEAALWMKENSDVNDKIFSVSKPQTFYYSQRETLTYTEFLTENGEYELIEDSEKFEEFLLEERPKYVTVSIFEYLPPWINPYIEEHRNMFFPVQGYLMGNQPVLIIYEVNYDAI
ncbi:MAG: hypothetical protein AABW46_03125, partial [Nanoarchaeota archaeon]